MNIEAINSPVNTGFKPTAPEQVSTQRKEKAKVSETPQSPPEASKVQPEEVLSEIKSLTENGNYSVHFELNDISNPVVKIIDNESQEVLRQFPAEEVLSFKANFQEMLGNIVNTKG